MKRYARYIAFALTLLLLFPWVMPAKAEKETGLVRVLLTRLKLTNQADIALDGSYTLNDLAFQRGSHLTVLCEKNTLYVYYGGMSLNAGKTLILTRHETRDGLENGVRFNGAYELHPGSIHLSIANGFLQAVLYAPVEEYLLGVVPYEMSDSFPLEALKAQAVAARTYALRKAGTGKEYDLVDNTNDQAYYGVKVENKNAAQAVKETEGLCGYYQGSLAECYYSASNGGQTELASHVWGKGNYNYLLMADDPYDLENPESVVRKASLPKKLSGNEDLGPLKEPILSALTELMESRGCDGDVEHIRVTGITQAETALPMYRDSPSRVMTLLRLFLTVEGRRLLPETQAQEEDASIFEVFENATPAPTASPAPVPGEKWSPMETLPEPVLVTLDIFPSVEQALNLSINASRNELITVRETNDAFVLESRRFGHGVGMSQRGAQQMAKVYHWTYDQILRFYYPGMQVQAMRYTYAEPEALNQRFLTTPGPAATPTPRPTPMAVRSTPGPAERKVRVVNIGVTSYLNLRSQPSTQSEVVQLLYYGQELIVTKDVNDEWLAVRTDDLSGFVMKQFVE